VPRFAGVARLRLIVPLRHARLQLTDALLELHRGERRSLIDAAER
jgi:hypothetical protein